MTEEKQFFRGRTPQNGAWGPMNTRSEITKRAWESLDKPPFFITIYVDDKTPEQIQFLIHGKASIALLKDVHDMIDEFVLQALRDVASNRKSEPHVK